LCIITTRIAVHELADRAAVISHDLQNLAPVDGVKLLQSLGVQGKPSELDKAVREYGCHALALTLLGNVLRLRYQGDVQRRDTLKALVKSTGSKESRHAFKVMQAYEEWFAGQPELALLHLLGLFDHPIEQAVLQVLWDAQIPHLTAGIDEDDWLEAIAGLREEHHLLSQHDGDLDCHPLIREYFGKQLQTQHPDAWQQAHARLYDYYKALPEKELPDTLEEMQPLFSAVAHGCAAGYYQCSLMKIYWPRVQRKEEFYLTKKLGAFSDELETIRHFFAIPWRVPADTLSDFGKAWLLAVAGFCLRAQGRLREALEPTQTALIARIQQEHWKNAAITASTFSELQLSLGDINAALDSASQSIEFANKSNCWELQMMNLTTIAHALHQSSRIEEAYQQFRTAEVLQKKYQPNYQYLYGLQGFYYCNLLLSQGKDTEVLLRARSTQEWVMNAEQDILSAALDELSLSQVYLQQCDWSQAGDCIENAILGLRHYSSVEYALLALLARAALFRHTHDFARARQDLQEVFDIAEPSGMRLFLTDYHLEMARLLVAEGWEGGNSREAADPAYHIAEAERLINATGYHRRDQELLDLQQALAKESCP
jgi:tetratricopeptide (TPR) repeat protein